MSSVDVYEAALRMLERYGFGIMLAVSVLWFVRTDIVLPMVDAHKEFLVEMARTQRDISAAVTEQTRLIQALQPARDSRVYTSAIESRDEEKKN